MNFTHDIEVEFKESMGQDSTIIEVARQSTTGAFRGWPEDEKLLRFLYEHSHSTPQEYCVLHVECRVPVFVARQVMRHRTLTFSEMSGRYVEIPERAYHPLEWKEQSTKNKQASAGPIEEQLQADAVYEGLITESVATYKQLLALGISREQARMVLPLSMMTQFRVIGNLRNWFHFLGLRLDKHAQDETRVMAQQVADIIAERWPRSWALFEEKVLK